MNFAPTRACLGKRKYECRMEAQARLNLRHDQARQWPHRYEHFLANGYQHSAVYECFWCGKFHIGRLPRELRKPEAVELVSA